MLPRIRLRSAIVFSLLLGSGIASARHYNFVAKSLETCQQTASDLLPVLQSSDLIKFESVGCVEIREFGRKKWVVDVKIKMLEQGHFFASFGRHGKDRVTKAEEFLKEFVGFGLVPHEGEYYFIPRLMKARQKFVFAQREWARDVEFVKTLQDLGYEILPLDHGLVFFGDDLKLRTGTLFFKYDLNEAEIGLLLAALEIPTPYSVGFSGGATYITTVEQYDWSRVKVWDLSSYGSLKTLEECQERRGKFLKRFRKQLVGGHLLQELICSGPSVDYSYYGLRIEE